MKDLRQLLDKYHIAWRDHGKNVSHGNIVICCPFCTKTTNPDPGEHLAVSSRGEYFCFRNPKHAGRNIAYLLKELKIPGYESDKLEKPKFDQLERKVKTDFSEFQFFIDAEFNFEATQYLHSRLFTNPDEVCRKFRLKTQIEGRMAGRLIIPLTVGYTGRAMRAHIEPRYLTQGTQDSYFSYKQGASSCMIVEGAIDAMKVVVSTSQFDVRAKCGNRLSPALLADLRDSKYLSIYNTPDKDIPFTSYFEEMKILSSYCTFPNLYRFKMPDEFKDFGQMTEDETRQLIYART